MKDGEEGTRYDIEIDFGADHGGKRTLSQDGKRLFGIKAFSHCRNFVDILAADVKEIKVRFKKRVVVTAVQVLVCAVGGQIDMNLQDEESLLMLRTDEGWKSWHARDGKGKPTIQESSQKQAASTESHQMQLTGQ